MEYGILSEVEKHKEHLTKELSKIAGDKLSPSEFTSVINLLSVSINNMIKLMREGKSTHDKLFSDIISNSIDAIVGMDISNKIFIWNKGAENIFGYSREEITGKDISILIPQNKMLENEKAYLWKQLNQSGYVSNYETERITKDGKILDINMTRYAIYDDSKNIIASVGILRDVTHIKKLEKELREKENLALIGQVVSSIAHSLSNPLNIISGTADYLLLDKHTHTEGYTELKTIVEEATRITSSIRQLMNFSRPLKMNKQICDINKLISDIFANLKYSAGKKKISFRKNLDRNMPAITCDVAQIRETISNIVTNAIQSIQSEGEVKISTDISEGEALIEITDNGSGIAKENLDKIFEPFFSSKEYGKGTGLGLAIAKRIIKEHGGEISVNSRTGKGTVFRITIPFS
jgi:two-component system, sporulation sensor kinase E